MSHTTAILVAEQPTVLAVHQNDCSSNQRHQEQGDPASPDAEQQQHTVSDLESSQTREPIITGASACRSQRSCRQDGRPEDIANDQSRGDAARALMRGEGKAALWPRLELPTRSIHPSCESSPVSMPRCPKIGPSRHRHCKGKSFTASQCREDRAIAPA